VGRAGRWGRGERGCGIVSCESWGLGFDLGLGLVVVIVAEQTDYVLSPGLHHHDHH